MRTRLFFAMILPSLIFTALAALFIYQGTVTSTLPAFFDTFKNNLELQYHVLLALIGVFSVYSFFCLGVSHAVAEPLEKTTSVLRKMALNNFTHDIHYTDRTDEVGMLARAATAIRKNALERRTALEEQNFKNTLQERKIEKLEKNLEAFRKATGTILDDIALSSSSIKATSQTLKNATEQTEKTSTTIASATQQTEAALRAIAATARESAYLSKKIDKEVVLSQNRKAATEKSFFEVKEEIRQISAHAAKCGHFAEFIADIAEQLTAVAMTATLESLHANNGSEESTALFAANVRDVAHQARQAAQGLNFTSNKAKLDINNALQTLSRLQSQVDDFRPIFMALSDVSKEQNNLATKIIRTAEHMASGSAVMNNAVTDAQQAASLSDKTAAKVMKAIHQVSSGAQNIRQEISSLIEQTQVA